MLYLNNMKQWSIQQSCWDRKEGIHLMGSRTLKHNNSSACDSHPGGQGALGWLKCCGSWKSLSLWMLCLHSDKALKVLQFFTSHRPKAGPPDITTQPLPLTGARIRKRERCLHSFKHSPMLYQYLFMKSKLARTGYLAGVCSSLWRSVAPAGQRCDPRCTFDHHHHQYLWDQSSKKDYCWPHWHLANCWQMLVQTYQFKKDEIEKSWCTKMILGLRPQSKEMS